MESTAYINLPYYNDFKLKNKQKQRQQQISLITLHAMLHSNLSTFRRMKHHLCRRRLFKNIYLYERFFFFTILAKYS